MDSLEEALRALREQQRHDHNALLKLDIMMADQTRALEAQRKWNEDNSRRVLAMEGAIQAATVTSNQYSKEKADELKVTLEAYIPKAMGDIEAKSNRRLDKIEQFLAVLEKAKPGEDENWLNMLKFLDAEVEKLKSYPKADGAFGQSILDEAKNVIKCYASNLKQEFGGQLASAAGTVAQVNAYVDNRLGAVETRLAATDAAFTALQMQLGPAVAALHAQAFPARQRTAEAPSRFCGGFSMPQRSADHRGPCCGSVEGSLPHADEPAQAKPSEGPPGVSAASRAEDDGKPCHCLHVAKLMVDTDILKIRANQLEGRIDGLSGGSAQRHGAQAYGDPQRQFGHAGGPPQDYASSQVPQHNQAQFLLPLSLGPMGSCLSKGRAFDDRLCGQPEFQFNGSKGGDAWRGKTERYFISKVPALHMLLQWAERQEGVITDDLLAEAVGDGLTEWDRDGTAKNYTQELNCALWGFLSNCLSGEAEIIFRQGGTATVNKGVDAWRRIVRYIDHGRGIRLELMRNKWRTIRSRPIKSLEAVTIGIAEFENTVLDYVSAGGVQPGQDEMKSDLNAILPPNLSEQLAIRISDSQYSYQAFRDFVLNQTAQAPHPRGSRQSGSEISLQRQS